MRPRVLIDVDGPLANFLEPCLAIINDIQGTRHALTDITGWNIFEALGCSDGITEATYERLSEYGWCRALPVCPGSVEAVRELRNIAIVYFVTAPLKNHPTWAHERMAWLAHHFGATEDNVISGHAKHVCAGDALIDDKTPTLIRWKKSHPDGLAIRWMVPTNSLVDYEGISTNDWEMVVREISALNGNRPRTWNHA